MLKIECLLICQSKSGKQNPNYIFVEMIVKILDFVNGVVLHHLSGTFVHHLHFSNK